MAFNIGNKYNFNTLIPALLNSSYKNMKVVGIMTASEAIRAATYYDIESLHTSAKQVIPSLPDYTSSLTYILFENTDGDKIPIANEYIDQTSIVLVETVDISITVYNRTTADIAVLRQLLRENGFTNITIS